MTRPRVPAKTVRAHITRLQAHGMTGQRIARAAGVHDCTISRILKGHIRSVQYDTARLILAVEPDITVEGLCRRVRALIALGWSEHVIAHVAGLNRATIARYASGKITYPKREAVAGICRAYDALSGRVPTPRNRFERSGVTKLRGHAARHRWAPPLAWDDIDRDKRPPRVRDEVPVVEDVEWLARAGESLENTAARLGFNSPETLEKAQYRWGRRDLVAVLKHGEGVAA